MSEKAMLCVSAWVVAICCDRCWVICVGGLSVIANDGVAVKTVVDGDRSLVHARRSAHCYCDDSCVAVGYARLMDRVFSVSVVASVSG